MNSSQDLPGKNDVAKNAADNIDARIAHEVDALHFHLNTLYYMGLHKKQATWPAPCIECHE